MIRWSAGSTPSAAYWPAPAAGTAFVVSSTVPPPSRSTSVARPASNGDPAAAGACGPPRRPGHRADVPAIRTGSPCSGSVRPPTSRSTRAPTRARSRGRPPGRTDRAQERRHAAADQRLEQDGRVAGRARADVVADVEQDDRARVGVARGPRSMASSGSGRARVALLAQLPGEVARGGRRPARGELPVAVRDGNERHAHVRRRRRTGSPRRCWRTACRARARARARRRGTCASDRIAVPWHRMFSASGGFSIAWTGAISPRTVRAISSAQVRAPARGSRRAGSSARRA